MFNFLCPQQQQQPNKVRHTNEGVFEYRNLIYSATSSPLESLMIMEDEGNDGTDNMEEDEENNEEES